MKRRLSFVALTLLALCVALMVVTCFDSPNGRCDFHLRMNELACLRQGVNPFSVWHEDVVCPPYCSNLPKAPVPAGCTEQVNAYVPWAYTFMFPLSYLPQSAAWAVYCLFMGVALLVVFCVSIRFASGDANARRLVAAVSLVAISYLLWSNVAVGNFIAFVLAASVAMAWCLSRGHDLLAGVCWAIAMMKPQSAILFAVPLLMKKKLWTCGVATAVCLVASVVPKLMCNASLIELLRDGPAANAELFLGSATYPRCFLGIFENSVEIGIGLTIGFVICVGMTWFVRKERDWMTVLMPAAICGASWTYTQAYSHAMGWFVVFVLVRELIRNPRSKFLWALFVVSAFVLSRWFLAWHGLCSFAGCRFPMSEYAFRCVDSLNSTASLAIACVVCAIIWRHADSDVAEIKD